MPMMNGEQFYREVLKTKPHLAPYFIFLTGDVVNKETQQFLTSTNNPHLDKPFQLSKLEAVGTEVLAKKEAQRAINGSRASLMPA
jgi:CheY-like chemotaxis protein